MSCAPTVSENIKVKNCAVPLPFEGDTDTAVGGCGGPLLVTVKVAFCNQPLSSVALCASMYMFFAPAKAALNDRLSDKLKLFPERSPCDVLASSAHWLFCIVPGLPSVRPAPNDPASLASWI